MFEKVNRIAYPIDELGTHRPFFGDTFEREVDHGETLNDGQGNWLRSSTPYRSPGTDWIRRDRGGSSRHERGFDHVICHVNDEPETFEGRRCIERGWIEPFVTPTSCLQAVDVNSDTSRDIQSQLVEKPE